ncbi:MAG: ECF transporter S component [Clostridia bacterium]|nr:ECF transporter S component [Clostridia bacterium]
MKTKNSTSKTLQLTELAILMALVVVLQSISSFGVVTVCLCLVPLTLGSIVLGWKNGGILGFAFGLVALFWGIVGKDIFTMYLFQANPLMTIAICVVKGTLAGIVPGLIYKALEKCNAIVASVVAAISAPVVNTGIFALGCWIIKEDVIFVSSELGLTAQNFFLLLFGGLITFNFFLELGINTVFAPALGRLVSVLRGMHHTKK